MNAGLWRTAAQASQLAQSTTRQCVRPNQVQTNSLSLVLEAEHVGQKTVGYATREGANVEIMFEDAKVRRPLLPVDSVVENEQVAVFTDSGGFIISRSALQVDGGWETEHEDRTDTSGCHSLGALRRQ